MTRHSICKFCYKKFPPTLGNPNNFCSKPCYWKSMKGKIMPPGVIERLANFNRGKKRPIEVCLKISKARKGQKPSPQCIEAARKAATGRPKTKYWYKAMKKLCGPNNHKWKGGRCLHGSGYILILCKKHPHPNNIHGYVFEHRLIVERAIGRYLLPEEIVHHRNHIKNDNRLENLQLFSDNSSHMKHHFPNGPNPKRL